MSTHEIMHGDWLIKVEYEVLHDGTVDIWRVWCPEMNACEVILDAGTKEDVIEAIKAKDGKEI